MNKHIHKYMKVILGGRRIVIKDGRRYIEKTGGYPVMKCTVPKCTHYIAQDLAIGRSTICWKCGNEFVLNSENVQLKRPLCYECRKRKVA